MWLIFAARAARLHLPTPCRRAVCITGAAAALLVLLSTRAHADEFDTEKIVRRAEASFKLGIDNQSRLLLARKYFSHAADAYLELHGHGIRTPALYRSLGNAGVLADRWPEAIWAYHVGLKLDPNDRALREQLAFVRGKVLTSPTGLGRSDGELWPIWLYRPTYRDLMLIVVALNAWAWLVGACAFVQRKPRLALLTAAFAVAAFAAGASLWLEMRQARNDRDMPVIIMAANADFHRGNGPSYPRHPVLPTLPRGLEARQIHRRGHWLQVRLTTGETGWVHVSQVLIVEP